jgi:hypothetical protein
VPESETQRYAVYGAVSEQGHDVLSEVEMWISATMYARTVELPGTNRGASPDWEMFLETIPIILAPSDDKSKSGPTLVNTLNVVTDRADGVLKCKDKIQE